MSNEFTQKLIDNIKENAAEFESRGIDISRIDEDIGYFVEGYFKSLAENPSDVFLASFKNENGGLIGDNLATSKRWKETHPYRVSMSYKGVEMCAGLFGAEIYSGPYEYWNYIGQLFLDSNFVGLRAIKSFVDGDHEYRDYLMSKVDYNYRRNWAICWAYTDWIKTQFPEAYEKMMKDGNFLSVEELREKMEENK